MTAGGPTEQRANALVGEERVERMLESLAGHGVRAVHDRSAPDSDATLDHLVVASSGVFVIDAKSWSGVLSTGDGRLSQNGIARDDAVADAGAQAETVRRFIDGLAPPHPITIRSVISFAGSAQIGRPARIADVDLVDLNQLATLITHGEPQLAPAEVEFIAEQFRTRFAPRTGYTAEESLALPMEVPPESIVFLTRWTKPGHDRLSVMDENGGPGGFIDLATGDVLAGTTAAEPILRRLLPVHLATTTRDETTEEARGIISRFLRRRTAKEAQQIEPALVVGRYWEHRGRRRLYVHRLGPRGNTTDLGWFDLADRRVHQASPDAAPIVRYCGERYLVCRAYSSD